MQTIDLMINGNKHTIACNDGEEARLKSLADKFNTKLKQLAPSLKQADDKTLYLITALVLLDETDENKTSSTEQAFIETISNKLLSVKKLLVE